MIGLMWRALVTSENLRACGFLRAQSQGPVGRRGHVDRDIDWAIHGSTELIFEAAFLVTMYRLW
jgi:hypothetical protein